MFRVRAHLTLVMARAKGRALRAQSGVRKPPRAAADAAAAAARAARAARAAAAAPTYVFTAPCGARGEVLRLRREAAAPPGDGHATAPAPLHVVLLPGNPGVVECYRAWLVELRARLPADVRSAAALHALGYPGHDLRALNGDKTFGIEACARYVAAYLRSAQVSPPLADARLVLVGHSFGSFLALRILAADPALAARARLVMLMPALYRMADARPPLVRLVTNPTAEAVLVPIVAALGSIVPSRAVRAALEAIGVAEDGAATAVARMFDGHRPSLHRACLALAREEMEAIKDPADEPVAAAIRADRAFLYWTDGDVWCTEEAVAAIRRAFGPLTVQSAGAASGGTPVSHAFSTSVPQLEAVARCVSSWITDIARS